MALIIGLGRVIINTDDTAATAAKTINKISSILITYGVFL